MIQFDDEVVEVDDQFDDEVVEVEDEVEQIKQQLLTDDEVEVDDEVKLILVRTYLIML